MNKQIKKKPIQIHIYPSLLRIDQSIDRFIDPIDSLFESIKKVSEFFIFAESSSRSSSSKSEKPKSFKKCWIPLKNNNNGKNEKRISTSRQNTSREKKNLQHNLTGNGFFFFIFWSRFQNVSFLFSWVILQCTAIVHSFECFASNQKKNHSNQER